MKNQLSLINREVISSVLLLLLAAWIWYHSSGFPDLPEGYPGPKLFPRIIALGLGGIGLIIGLGQFRRKSPEPEEAFEPKEDEDKSFLRLGLGVVCIALFPLISPLIGFIPSLLVTGALMGLTLKLVWWRSILTASITVALIYLIFSKLLNVPL